MTGKFIAMMGILQGMRQNPIVSFNDNYTTGNNHANIAQGWVIDTAEDQEEVLVCQY